MPRFLWTLALGLLLLSSGSARAQESPPSADQKAIEQAAVDFVDAYNAKNAEAVAALFNEKSRVETADGEILEGREKIKAGFEAAFKEDPDAQISLSMESLIFVTADVAVEQGATEFFPDGDTLTSRSKYLVVHLKKDGKWRIISARTLAAEIVSNYEYLRKLEFMVGDWIDEDAASVVESSVRWDEGKSFLMHDFSVREGKTVVQKGTHRIGWDSQKKQFRGWVFDNDGGFGETAWDEVDGSWVWKSTGVTKEGDSRSATRTLTPMGDRIQVRISDRVADGKRVPDVEFMMVRKPPAPVAAAAKKPLAEGSR